MRIVVPFGPGTSTDVAARLLAPALARRWQRPVVVDNRPSGDGVAGVAAFVREADPHALLFAPLGIVTANVLLHERLPFDAHRDLVPVAAVVRTSIGIAVGRHVAARSLEELAALAQLQPGKLRWAASAGLPELSFRAFVVGERLTMTHVPYRDMPQAVRDLEQQRIEVLAIAIPALRASLDASAVRLLAVNASSRLRELPDAPTVSEAGWPQLTVDSPQGLFAGRDLPAAVRERIAADVSAIAADAELVARLARLGFAVEPSTPEEFGQAIERQRGHVERMARVIGLVEEPSR